MEHDTQRVQAENAKARSQLVLFFVVVLSVCYRVCVCVCLYCVVSISVSFLFYTFFRLLNPRPQLREQIGAVQADLAASRAATTDVQLKLEQQTRDTQVQMAELRQQLTAGRIQSEDLATQRATLDGKLSERLPVK